jgi:SAM-dependent methyltransferase
MAPSSPPDVPANARLAACRGGDSLELPLVLGGHPLVNDSNAIVESAESLAASGLAPTPVCGKRPPSRLSDVWKSPLTDLPIRDELLFQYLPLSPSMDVLEVGPGTGFTAFRLARMVKSMTIVDVAAGNITRLREVLAGVPNVDFVCADLCVPGLAASLKRQFDIVEAIEVFEFLPAPAIALQNMGAALRSGGRLFLQFPNYRPPRSHGVTCFERWNDLHGLLRAAGFKNCEVYSLRLRPYADFLFRNLHEKPLSSYRWLRRSERASRPQTFENVWTYRHGGRLQKYKSLIYVAWMAVMAACRAGGDCFIRTPLNDDIMDRNLLVVAER